MKKIIFLLGGLFCFLQPIYADGGVFFEYGEKVYLPEQKAVISWDGEKKEERLLISTKIRMEDEGSFSWVVPISSEEKPEVEKGEVEIFFDLTKLFYPKESFGFLGVQKGEEAGEVEVLETKKVDIYEIAILKATDGKVLINWLNNNGFFIPDKARGVLDEYVGGGFYFVANKVNLANLYRNLGMEELTFGEKEKECLSLVREGFFLEERFNKREIDYLLDEYSECQLADRRVVAALLELERGVATPLLIKFKPKKAYYPFKISSINEGKTKVNVYVASDYPVKDSEGILRREAVTENVSSIKDYGFEGKYVSYLTFSGDLKDLKSDAWFEKTKYDKNLDPNYESIGEKVFAVFYVLLGGVLVVLFYGGPVVFLGVIVFIVYKLLRKKKRR